jgi:hypothetical protein
VVSHAIPWVVGGSGGEEVREMIMGACNAVEEGEGLRCQGIGWGILRGERGRGRKGGMSGGLRRAVGVVGVVGVWTVWACMNRLEKGRRYSIDVHSGDGWGGGRVGWGVRVGGRGKVGCAVGGQVAELERAE